MNETGRSFIGGLLKYARAIDAVIAPTVNCLRRRRRHTFSPTNISWGLEDRSALIRVKGGGRSPSTSSTGRPRRCRTPTSSAPALVAAGLRGIEEGLSAPEPSKPGCPPRRTTRSRSSRPTSTSRSTRSRTSRRPGTSSARSSSRPTRRCGGTSSRGSPTGSPTGSDTEYLELF